MSGRFGGRASDRAGGRDAQGFSELDNEYNEGTDEYRDKAAEATAQARGYKEDNEQVETGPTRPERLEFVGRFGGRGSDRAGARDVSPETHLKLAKHFEEMAAKSQNYPDAQKKYKEMAEQNRQKAASLGKDFAMDPPVSQAQRAAMHAAAQGKSTLGIPKSVGQEFANADPGGKLPAKAKDETSRESPSSKEKSEYNEGTSFHGQWRRPPESSENRPSRPPPPKTNLRSGR